MLDFKSPNIPKTYVNGGLKVQLHTVEWSTSGIYI